MKGRLANWKGNLLSLAGRNVLVESVLSSLPVYSMNMVKLPKAIYSEIDKISRNFLWLGSLERHEVHLINWEMVCKRKKNANWALDKLES